MSILQKKNSQTTTFPLIILFLITAAVLLMTILAGCSSLFDDKDRISELSFSHDGKKVVFDRCKNEGCQIQVYDLETGELAAYQSPKGERWTMGKYSYDGRRIAISVIPITPGGLYLNGMQIAVMDADGKNLKIVTTGPGAKLYPAFSHNGKKILYARAATIRTKGGTPASGYDAWEVNLETGEQTQLTFYEYYYLGNLTYFPDDERFIFWGEMPSVYEGVRVMGGGSFIGKMVELGEKGMWISGVAVMKGKEPAPSPYHSYPKGTFPQRPLLSQDGSVMIYENSPSAKFYLYSENGKHRLLGEGGSVNSAAISPDGRLLAIIPASSATLHTYSLPEGKRNQSFYLAYALKIMKNYKELIEKWERQNGEKFTMIPAKPSHILNQ